MKGRRYENYQTMFEFSDQYVTETTDWYYVRVTQTNGIPAWSSPIWVEANNPKS